MRKIIGRLIKAIGIDIQRVLTIEIFLKKTVLFFLTLAQLLLWKILTKISRKLAGQCNILSGLLALLKKKHITERQFDVMVNTYFGIKNQSNVLLSFRNLYFGSIYKLKSIKKTSLACYKKIVTTLYKYPCWYSYIYIVGRWYAKIISLLPPIQSVKMNAPQRSILIYSKMHFDPDNDYTDRPLAQSSASNLARHLYASLSDTEIYYRDQREALIKDSGADIVLGIVSKSFITYAKDNPNAKKIIFLVNSHPLYRTWVMQKEANLRKKFIPSHEYVSPFTIIRCLYEATDIVLIGNDSIKNTYYEYGCKKRILLINSGVNSDLLTPLPALRPQERVRVLFSASDLGVRKGIFRLISLWDHFSKSIVYTDTELIIVGKVTNFKSEIQDFVKRHPNVHIKGWVDSNTPEYLKILQSSHIILSLSLEEGQVGCVLEAMSTGAIPIITQESGIPIEHKKNGYVINDYPKQESDVIHYIERLCSDKSLLEPLHKASRTYIMENHTWGTFVSEIRKIIYASN
ncbi:MAG: glycosyltransferase family 4 protein [Patescibacteria group bacterium]